VDGAGGAKNGFSPALTFLGWPSPISSTRARTTARCPDWLLIYGIAGDELHLVPTGSHADLFDE
jgi:hypothetical protein